MLTPLLGMSDGDGVKDNKITIHLCLPLPLLPGGVKLWIPKQGLMSYMGQDTLGATENKHILKHLGPQSKSWDLVSHKKIPLIQHLPFYTWADATDFWFNFCLVVGL